MLELVDALIQGEDAADAEQDDRHHEGVDVALPAVAERVLGVCFLLGNGPAAKQQDLIAGVRKRVHTLAQHGTRTRDAPRDEFGNRDPEVRRHRRNNRFGAALCAHAVNPRMGT